MVYKTISPVVIAGNHILQVDARELFETYEMQGRFRDWVRRTLKPYLSGIHVDLVRYTKDDANPKQKNYYFPASFMRLVVDICITPKLPVATTYTAVSIDRNHRVTAAAPVRDNRSAVEQAIARVEGRAGGVVNKANTAIVRAEITKAVTASLEEVLKGLDSLLAAPAAVAPTVALVPAARAPEGVVERNGRISFTVRWHPYSTNLMYVNSGGRVHRSKGYNSWCHKIDTLIPNAPAWFSKTAPLKLKFKFGHVVGFDVDNFIKSAIDALARKWNFNDAIVDQVEVAREIVPEHNGMGSGLQNGFIEYNVYQ